MARPGPLPILAATLLGFPILALAQKGDRPEAPAKATLTRRDQDPDGKRPVKLRVGEIVAVRLPTALASGYTWVPNQLDKSRLCPIGEGREVGREPGGPLGGESLVEYRFQAEREGSVRLDLRNMRPFDKTPPSDVPHVFQATIKVDRAS